MNLTTEDRLKAHIRRLIWLYFSLLLIEGALRKWVLPQLSNPLLIVRDPVVILAYLLAIRARLFPWNGWVYAAAAIGGLSFATSFIQLWPYIPPTQIALVSGYGFRANFLHLPLMFLIPRVMRPEDVKKLGWWILITAVPMALLMVAQFRAAPDAWLNRTAGGEGEMMTSALGKVRTAGPFSFVVGVVAYFALATAYLIWAVLRQNVYKQVVLIAAGMALVIGTAVSGSRSVVGACAVVVASVGIVLLVRPRAVNRVGQTLVVMLIVAFIISKLPVFKEGFDVLSTRFNEAAEAGEQTIAQGVLARGAAGFTDGLFVLGKAPFLGYGLGIGTNAGAKFLTGRSIFLLSEGEWSRIFLESGPLLGLAYVLWRCAIVVRIGILCLRSVRFGNVLPLLLFSAGFLSMLNGQFGQPTVLGFSVFVMGLALAARNIEHSTTAEVATATETRPPPATPRRSEFARRLHDGAGRARDHTNGSVDR
jgi:hypothetical protein